jgi:hypothetical protein
LVLTDYAAHVPSALGIPSIEPNDFAVLGFFIQDYAAYDPSALGIPSIEPNYFAVFVFFYSGLCCACSQRIGHSKHRTQTALQFLVFFIQDYAAHVPSALGIPSIAPVNALHCLVFFISPSFQKYFLTLF